MSTQEMPWSSAKIEDEPQHLLLCGTTDIEGCPSYEPSDPPEPTYD